MFSCLFPSPQGANTALAVHTGWEMGFYSLDCSHVHVSSHLSSSILFLSEAEKSAFGEKIKKKKKRSGEAH